MMFEFVNDWLLGVDFQFGVGYLPEVGSLRYSLQLQL